MRRRGLRAVVVGVVVAMALTAGAGSIARAEAITGGLRADAACLAPVSKNTGRNPGEVRLRPGRLYEIRERNRTPATHYRLRVPHAPRETLRWVAKDCGTALLYDGAAVNVLALSWQPSFCEIPPAQGKPECRTQTAGRFDARHLSLHGLWPNRANRDLDEFCGVDPVLEDWARHRRDEWARLPKLSLTDALRATLGRWMPGSAYQRLPEKPAPVTSAFHRYEWLKHGTCYEGRSPQIYFENALRYLKEIDASAVGALLRRALESGDPVAPEALEAAFREAFGAAAARRFYATCRLDGGRRLLAELHVFLDPAADQNQGVADLMATAIEAAPQRRMSQWVSVCADPFLIDPAGLQ